MSDQIIGTAILIPPGEDGHGYLHYVGRYADGRTFIDEIPVYWAGAGKPAWATRGGRDIPMWAMRWNGDTLDCHPSINDITRGWHNSFNWSVRFKVADPDPGLNAAYQLQKVNAIGPWAKP